MSGFQGFFAFAETARHGSFAGAARELGLSPSAVAKSVARLEQDLGLRLFHRTTRQVTLTGEGQELYARCRRIVDEVEGIRAEAEGVRGQPSGTLRLSVPTTYGKRVVVPALVRLANRHPKLSFDVGFSDRWVDLVQLGLDAVVRIGELGDSTLVARRLGEQALVTCANSTYLRRRGTPKTPSDLDQHDCLVFRLPSSGRPRAWQFHEGRRTVEFVPPTRCVMNDGEAVVVAATLAAGIAQVPDYMAAEALRAGRLTEVLVTHRPKPMPISLVYPSARHVTPRLRALIDALVPAR
ncbi:MAG: LysR substrate-binding domain-containing protein [Betaproteobacteria bacterium]